MESPNWRGSVGVRKYTIPGAKSREIFSILWYIMRRWFMTGVVYLVKSIELPNYTQLIRIYFLSFLSEE